MHHQQMYNDTAWLPINITHVEEEMLSYNPRLNFNDTSMDMSNPMSGSIYSNMYSDKIITPSDQLSSRTIENELKILNLDKLMSFVSPNNVVEMTVTTMASNIIVALGWIILGTFYLGAKLMAGADSQISLFADILGPQAVGGNVMRCIVGFLFTFAGIVGKTMLTIGMHDTMHQFVDKDMGEYWNMVSNDKFLKDSLIRGILSTMFLVLGWTFIGLIAKTAIFSYTNIAEMLGLDFLLERQKKRRRKRSISQKSSNQSYKITINPFSHIERNIPLISNDNPSSLNDFLIGRSFKKLSDFENSKS